MFAGFAVFFFYKSRDMTLCFDDEKILPQPFGIGFVQGFYVINRSVDLRYSTWLCFVKIDSSAGG